MKLKIGFTGDIAFSEYTKNIRNQKKAIDNKVFDILNKNDFNILNFESPITESNITKKNALAHKSDPENLLYIKEKFKNPILSIANNHMMDFGVKGLVDTIKNINRQELPYIGAGSNQNEATNYIIVGDKVKVGILSFQYKDYIIAGENTPGTAHDKHLKLIRKKIQELKKMVDWVVLVYHGGEEFLNYPMPYTRKKFNKFLNMGIDIIVAHHPHTVQGYEKIGNKVIFYSLGNFIFDTDFQRTQKGTDEGLLVNISFTKKNFTYKVVYLKKDREKNILKVVTRNNHYIDIAENYNKKWKKEALVIRRVRKNKKRLKKLRNNYSISNLHINKIEKLEMMSFDDLISRNYIEELNELPKFKDKNIVIRKLRKKLKKLKKLKKIDKEVIVRKLYLKYARYCRKFSRKRKK